MLFLLILRNSLGEAKQTAIFAFRILHRSGQTHGFWEMLNGSGVSSDFIPSHLFFPLIFCLDLLQLMLQGWRLTWCVVSRFWCAHSYLALLSPHSTWLQKQELLTVLYLAFDSVRVVTFLSPTMHMLWTGLLMMAQAEEADLYWFKNP